MTHHEIARCDCDPCRHARAARREFNGRAREPDMIRMLDSPYWRRTMAEPSRYFRHSRFEPGRCQCSVPQGIGRICSWCGLPWRHG